MSFLELKAPFVQLRALLDGLDHPSAEVISLAVGEPQHQPPEFVSTEIIKDIAAGGLRRYPPVLGIDELRQSIASWVKRSFGVELETEKNIIPVCGTREALFLMGLLASHLKKAEEKIVFVPDPSYQCYAAAGFGAGCEVCYLPALKQNGFLPDLDFLEAELKTKYNGKKKTAIAFYLCSPANPQGAVADKNYLTRAARLARTYDFVLITDECYAEIYDSQKPSSILEVSKPEFKNVIAFHSLSKRSNLPGLRSGFCAGDAKLIENFRIMRELGGVAMPLPTQKASIAAWNDDAHTKENRKLYQAKFDLAEKTFGGFKGFFRPQGGFFLWFCLDEFNVNAVEMTKKLYTKAGILVLPGNFLSQEGVGENYIRIALVADIVKLKIAFEIMVKIFNENK